MRRLYDFALQIRRPGERQGVERVHRRLFVLRQRCQCRLAKLALYRIRVRPVADGLIGPTQLRESLGESRPERQRVFKLLNSIPACTGFNEADAQIVACFKGIDASV